MKELTAQLGVWALKLLGVHSLRGPTVVDKRPLGERGVLLLPLLGH